MIQISQRDLTAQEKRQFLRSRIESIVVLIASFLVVLFLMASLFNFMVLSALGLIFKISKSIEFIIFWINNLAALVFSSRLLWQGIQSEIFHTTSIKKVKAEIVEVKTTRAIKREDMEDFGLAFYVEVWDQGKRKTLFLWGQYLDVLEYEGKFPNTHFVVTWRNDLKSWVLDTQVYGEYFEPEKVLPPFHDSTPWEELPENGDLMDITLDEINLM